MSFSELFEIKFLVLLFFSVVSCFSSEAQINDPVGRLLTDIRVGGLLDSNDAEYRKVLTRLLAGSRYSSRLNINGPAAEGYINFYLIDPMAAYRVDLPANVATAKLFGNCGYLGANNAIACDSSVFSKFFEDHKLAAEVPSTVAVEEITAYRESLISWVLGHELGHLANHDGAGYFEEVGSLSQTASPDELQQQKEIKADLYGAQLICRDSGDCDKLKRMLIALINEDVKANVGKSASVGVGLIWDYSSREIIKYFAEKDHPAFVYRATRMLSQMAKVTRDAGLISLMSTFSQHLQNGG